MEASPATRIGRTEVLRFARIEGGEATGYTDIDGAADFLCASRRYVQELLAKRALTTFKFGRLVRISVAELQEWAAQQAREAK